MKLPSLAIKNAQFTLTIVALLVLVGIVSYFNMPRSEDPQFDIPITLIEVIYPGASPTDIETLVVDPLEEEFADIDNIKKIESQIKNGGARIEVTFHYGSDPELAFNKVQLAVSSVKPSLPAGVQDLLVLKATPTAVAIVQLALWTEPADYKQMEFYAKLLEKRLETIESVKKADIWGYPQQVVAVDLNLDLLLHHKVSTTQVMQVLKGRAINITPGFVDANTRRFNVKTSGNFEKIDQLEETIIVSNDDFVLRLKDIARVSFGSQEPNYLAYFDKKPVIFVTVEQRINTNIFSLTKSIQQEIALFKQTVPPELKMEVLFEQAQSVESRVNGFFNNLWQGLVLVGLLSLLFLGLREALVVMIAIPLSFLIAIGWLDFAGFGLQQMSIVGLIIALGLLVDNAIVVTESIHRERKNHKSLSQAAAAGASKVGWAISSGTITTMLAFLPMLMLASDTGDFIRSMPVTVVLVLLASLLIALTLTPLLASKFLSTKASKVKTLQHYINYFAENIYATWLQKLFRLKMVVIAIAIASLLAMLSLFSEVGLSLFPKAEKPMILVNIDMPEGSTFARTQEIADEVSKRVRQHDLVNDVAQNVGRGNPRIYYNIMPTRQTVNFAQLFVTLNDFQLGSVEPLVDTIRSQVSDIAGAKITVKEFMQGPPLVAPISIRIVGEELAEIQRVAIDVENLVVNTAGTVGIDNPVGKFKIDLKVDINRDKAAMLNVPLQQVDRTVRTALVGTNMGSFRDDEGEEYPLVLRLSQYEQPQVETFEDINVLSNSGQLIPLLQIAELNMETSIARFQHYDLERMARITSDVKPGFTAENVTNDIIAQLEAYDFPTGVHYAIGGEQENRKEAFGGMAKTVLLAVFGIFAVLVLQFRSFVQPLIVFAAIPFALIGPFIALFISGYTFSFTAFIGLTSLVGIVVNNSIILVDYANQMRRDGMEKIEAIMAAAKTRFVPIVLTTLTTVGGLLPLTLSGSSMWSPMGWAIIGGLLVSTLLTLIVVPVLYKLLGKMPEEPEF